MIFLLLTMMDGSQLVVKANNDLIVFETSYGLIRVPIGDFVDCQLAPRCLAEQDAKLKLAVADLGNEVYGKRESAMRFLKSDIRNAHRHLVKVRGKGSVEANKRVDTLLSSYGKAWLLFDTLQAKDGSFTGTIKQAFIECDSESLGKIKVDLSKVDRISRRNGIIQASISRNDGWKKLGYVSGKLDIVATGLIDTWPQQPGTFVASPEGTPGGETFEGYPVGSLIGRVGTKKFLVGSRFSTEYMDAGYLELSVNGANWFAIYQGEFNVEVKQ